MPLPLKIATTPHAHGAQVGEIIDLLCKPSICGPISDILGRDAFMEASTDLTQRLYLGECAAALARYSDENSNTIKPVGTIIYSQDSNDPEIANLELIVVREKYRRRKVGTRLLQLVETETALHGAAQLPASVPREMTDLQWLLAKNGFAFTEVVDNGGVLFLRYKKDLKRKDDQQKTGLPPESL